MTPALGAAGGWCWRERQPSHPTSTTADARLPRVERGDDDGPAGGGRGFDRSWRKDSAGAQCGDEVRAYGGVVEVGPGDAGPEAEPEVSHALALPVRDHRMVLPPAVTPVAVSAFGGGGGPATSQAATSQGGGPDADEAGGQGVHGDLRVSGFVPFISVHWWSVLERVEPATGWTTANELDAPGWRA